MSSSQATSVFAFFVKAWREGGRGEGGRRRGVGRESEGSGAALGPWSGGGLQVRLFSVNRKKDYSRPSLTTIC